MRVVRAEIMSVMFLQYQVELINLNTCFSRLKYNYSPLLVSFILWVADISKTGIKLSKVLVGVRWRQSPKFPGRIILSDVGLGGKKEEPLFMLFNLFGNL